MAEGGYDSTTENEDPWLNDQIDNDDYDDEEVDTYDHFNQAPALQPHIMVAKRMK